MFAGSSELSQPKQVIPQHHMGDQKERGVGLALGQSEELLSQLACRLVLPPFSIKLTESSQDREEVGGLARELTEFSRSRVGFSPLLGPQSPWWP